VLAGCWSTATATMADGLGPANSTGTPARRAIALAGASGGPVFENAGPTSNHVAIK